MARQPSATTTIADGPHQGRRARILNSSRPFVIVEDGKAAIYLYRSPGIHRFKGWCDVIDVDRPPAVPVVNHPCADIDKIREGVDRLNGEEWRRKADPTRPSLRITVRRRPWWRRLREWLWPTPIGGSDG